MSTLTLLPTTVAVTRSHGWQVLATKKEYLGIGKQRDFEHEIRFNIAINSICLDDLPSAFGSHDGDNGRFKLLEVELNRISGRCRRRTAPG